MAYRCLAEFLDHLAQRGALLRIDTEAQAVLEVAEVTRRVASQGGPALLWRAVLPSGMPVVTNLLGTPERLCAALDAESLAVSAQRIAELVDRKQPDGWLGRLGGTSTAGVFGRLAPRRVRAGPVQQVVRLESDVDLEELPALTMGPEEGGRWFTGGALTTVHPDSGELSGGVFPLQLLGSRTLAAVLVPTSRVASVLYEYQRRGQKMPVAVVFGGEPVLRLAAEAESIIGADPWTLAGLLREKPVEVVPARRVSFSVPAEAEVVLEGWIDPNEPLVPAGPFVTPTGHYGPVVSGSVVHVEAITHRANPVLPATVAGPPPGEWSTIRRALMQVFLPVLRWAVPGLSDCEFPEFGAGRHWAIVSVHKTLPGQARRVIHALWALPAFDPVKVLVVVDEWVDVHQTEAVLGAIAACAMPGRDVIVDSGPFDPFDPAQTADQPTRRMAIDATARLPGEPGPVGPRRVELEAELLQRISQRWPQLGLGPDNEADAS